MVRWSAATREKSQIASGFPRRVRRSSVCSYTCASILCVLSTCFFVLPSDTLKLFTESNQQSAIIQCDNVTIVLVWSYVGILLSFAHLSRRLRQRNWVKVQGGYQGCGEINEVKFCRLPHSPSAHRWRLRVSAQVPSVVAWVVRNWQAIFKHAVYMPRLPYITNLSSPNPAVRAYTPCITEKAWKATVIDGVIELFPCTVTRGAITSN